ncbi:hypothetical protein BH09BAC5_BH09BAC5_11700 [soil metagenome]
MKRLISVFAIFISANVSFGQNSVVNLHFKPTFNDNELITGKKYFCTDSKDSISIDLLSFYISGITFLQNDKIVAEEKNSYHLINISDTTSLKICCKLSKAISFDKIIFNLGIDSTTNVSGVMGGDLDPTKGMYWTWQSGYINLKLEGTDNYSNARDHEFQFHLGGYMQPNYSMQKIETAVENSSDLNFAINTEVFFSGIDLAKENHIMSPSIQAVFLSKKAAAMLQYIK